MVRWQASVVIVLLLVAITSAQARDRLPPGFVYLRDVDASIAQDIRYATTDNFTGHPLPGYNAGECILRREAALALKAVQAELRRVAHDPEKLVPGPDRGGKPVFGKDHAPGMSLGLKVYDCYRPTRAVRAMEAWARDGADDPATRRFYPALAKRSLFALGFIAEHSRHSTGTAVDLTLIRLPETPAARFDPAARYGPCIGPAARRAPDNSIDMGTGFDCFDARSHGASGAIGPEQKQWRATLQGVMRRHGFASYLREWWHYSFSVTEPRAYDFAIVPRGR